MGQVYMKDSKGEYYPISFNKIMSGDWEDKIVLVRIGTEDNPAQDKEVNEMYEALNAADALDSLENTSFLVTTYEVNFELL